MHHDEVPVDANVVRCLLAEQFPHWATLPVTALPTAGTVNAVFRIGDGLSARLPLRAGAPTATREWLEQEAAAAREFAGVSSVPSPLPVCVAEPGCGYPLPWSVQTWVPGDDALANDPASSMAFAEDLVRLLKCLRATDTRGRRFTGAGRGGHLPDHDAWISLCFRKSEPLLDVGALRAVWADLRTLPESDADVMCHGDLTPTNVLVDEGRLRGILDTGSFAPADPALDLIAAWHLLDEEPRQAVRAGLGCSEVQWRRGIAWAFAQAIGLVWYYAESNPTMAMWGRRTLTRVLVAHGR